MPYERTTIESKQHIVNAWYTWSGLGRLLKENKKLTRQDIRRQKDKEEAGDEGEKRVQQQDLKKDTMMWRRERLLKMNKKWMKGKWIKSFQKRMRQKCKASSSSSKNPCLVLSSYSPFHSFTHSSVRTRRGSKGQVMRMGRWWWWFDGRKTSEIKEWKSKEMRAHPEHIALYIWQVDQGRLIKGVDEDDEEGRGEITTSLEEDAGEWMSEK